MSAQPPPIPPSPPVLPVDRPLVPIARVTKDASSPAFTTFGILNIFWGLAGLLLGIAFFALYTNDIDNLPGGIAFVCIAMVAFKILNGINFCASGVLLIVQNRHGRLYTLIAAITAMALVVFELLVGVILLGKVADSVDSSEVTLVIVGTVIGSAVRMSYPAILLFWISLTRTRHAR